MANSIISTERKCWMCGATYNLELHHVFNGNPNRTLSGKYGLTVYLCHFCHNEPPNGIHHNKHSALILKQAAQQAAMRHYQWSTDDFIAIFGKNYL